jgi:hypothetical protein
MLSFRPFFTALTSLLLVPAFLITGACLAPVVSASPQGLMPQADMPEDQRLTLPPEVNANSGFGTSVAIDSGWAVVGAPFDDDPTHGPISGAAYVYRQQGDTWIFDAQLIGGDTAAADWFGASVDIWSGSFTQVLVGAPLDDNISGVDAGAAYVFTHDGTKWTQTRKVTVGHFRGFNDRFGSSVAIGRSDAVVAVPLEDTSANPVLVDAGSVSAFYRPEDWALRSSLNAEGFSAKDEHFGSALDHDLLTTVV